MKTAFSEINGIQPLSTEEMGVLIGGRMLLDDKRRQRPGGGTTTTSPTRIGRIRRNSNEVVQLIKQDIR